MLGGMQRLGRLREGTGQKPSLRCRSAEVKVVITDCPNRHPNHRVPSCQCGTPYSAEVQQRPLTAASGYDRQHTELAGTTAKRPAAPLVRDERRVLAVTFGRPDIPAHLRTGRLTRCANRPCKQSFFEGPAQGWTTLISFERRPGKTVQVLGGAKLGQPPAILADSRDRRPGW